MKLCKTKSGKIGLYEEMKQRMELCKGIDGRMGLYRRMDERIVN